jgi:hypothetical protein
MTDDVPFEVCPQQRAPMTYCATTLLIARGAYQAAAKMYPDELIELRQGTCVMREGDWRQSSRRHPWVSSQYLVRREPAPL